MVVDVDLAYLVPYYGSPCWLDPPLGLLVLYFKVTAVAKVPVSLIDPG